MVFDPALRAERSVTAGPTGGIRRVMMQPIVLWAAFLAVHILLALLSFLDRVDPLGDVLTVYKPWAQLAQDGQMVVGITTGWVYPIGAIVPIMAPLLLGADNYAAGWLVMVLLLDAAAFTVLVVGRHRRNLIAAWWWLGFLLVLGPIAIGRLDSVSVPIMIVALLWLGLRERLAVVLITIATWIKVWPAAIILSIMIVLRGRWRILGTVVATSLFIVILALTFGSGLNVLSFITMQAGRGLQIEAPASTPWMWASAFHAGHSFIYFDDTLLTFQVTGDGTAIASSVMTWLLGAAVIIVVLIGIRGLRHHASVIRVLPPLALALVVTLIAFNKVGSPQYVTWLAAPVILGIVYQGRAFRTPAILVGVIAALTQVIYPYLYDWLLVANPLMLLVLTARNILYFVVLGWTIRSLWGGARAGDLHEPDLPATAIWPFRTRQPENENY
jgi:Glycosyltransferase family 87